MTNQAGKAATIAVVIVTYNGETWIRGALDSVRASSTGAVTYVIDNASTDATVSIVRAEYPEVKLRETGENLGFGRGNNIGIREAMRDGVEYIFLLNQDAYLLPTSLAELAEFLDAHQEFGVASPLHCSPDTESVDPQTLRAYLIFHARDYLSDACIGQVKDHYAIAGINAAAWMVRSSVFARVGGFDPLFFMYGEDDDLLARFIYFGIRFALVPGSRIVHLRAKSKPSPVPFHGRIWRLSERERSTLLVQIKDPRATFLGKLLRLLLNGLFRPLLDAIENRRGSTLLAKVIATGRIALELYRIIRHTRVCSRPGPSFLD